MCATTRALENINPIQNRDGQLNLNRSCHVVTAQTWTRLATRSQLCLDANSSQAMGCRQRISPNPHCLCDGTEWRISICNPKPLSALLSPLRHNSPHRRCLPACKSCPSPAAILGAAEPEGKRETPSWLLDLSGEGDAILRVAEQECGTASSHHECLIWHSGRGHLESGRVGTGAAILSET